MQDYELKILAGRVARLEADMDELKARLGMDSPVAVPEPEPAALEQTARVQKVTQTEEAAAAGPRLQTPARNAGADIARGESWFKWSGIALVLFGLAFLFKYSIDRGWLVPAVRVGFGLLTGASLSSAGLRLFPRRRNFAQVLTGGGVAALFITGFAAFQLYELVPHAAAFAFMVAVAAFSYWASARHAALSMAVLAVAGALGTPFLLYTGSGSLSGLMLYTALVVSVAMIDFYRRGWSGLLWVSVVGGWAVLLAGLIQSRGFSGNWWLEGTGLFFWLAFWLTPVARTFRKKEDAGESILIKNDLSPRILTILSPGLALLLTWRVFSLPAVSLGWIALAGALLYAAFAGGLERLKQTEYAACHLGVAFGLFTLGLCCLLHGNALLLALALEGAALHFVNGKGRSVWLETAAHGLLLAAMFWLLNRLGGGFGQTAHVTAVLNPRALTDLAVLAVGLSASRRLDSFTRITYRLLLHGLFMFWLLRELIALPAGQAWVSLSWGLYALALMLSGLRLDRRGLRLTAFFTLTALLIKLFVVDLASIEALWRVLLFLGFGGAFLALGYWFRSLWKPLTDRPQGK